MNKLFVTKETITNINGQLKLSDRQDYEKCEFVNCTLTDISNSNFIECKFINCNLSSCKVNNTKFQSVKFVDCKLLGLNFFQAKDFAFEVYFENCVLDYASFDSKKLNKSIFNKCKMHEVNFTNSDLSKSLFISCDLYETLFSQTNLSGVDFTNVINFSIDPEINTIKKAKFLLHDLQRLLYKHDIIVE